MYIYVYIYIYIHIYIIYITYIYIYIRTGRRKSLRRGAWCETHGALAAASASAPHEEPRTTAAPSAAPCPRPPRPTW